MVIEHDICIGKLTSSSISALQILMKLPVTSNTAIKGGKNSDKSVEKEEEEDEEDKDKEESGSSISNSNSNTENIGGSGNAVNSDNALNKFLFEKVATITRARMKS